MSKLLTEQNFIDAAKELNIEVASIKAVAEVESAGLGFINNERNPKILYEPFVFGKRTNNKFINKTVLINGISFPLSLKGTWSAKASKYGKTSIQYIKLNAAIVLNHEEALKSCSWGKFQIMGFNYYLCNYSNVFLFVNDMYKSESKQLEIFCNFIQNNNKLHKALKNKDWKTFAYIYNGKKYYENKYDTKLKNAYDKYNVKNIIEFSEIPESLPIEKMPPMDPKLNKFIKLIKFINTRG